MVVALSVLYVLATVTWSIGAASLDLQWRLFGTVPFRQRRIQLNNVNTIEPFRFGRFWRVPLKFFGKNWPPEARLVIALRKGWIRGIVCVPGNHDALMRLIVDKPGRSRTG